MMLCGVLSDQIVTKVCTCYYYYYY